jgi:thioredoxin reductase/Pyruvate/2-oxoacid:ferredoxin oxidoreductase delta subunit
MDNSQFVVYGLTSIFIVVVLAHYLRKTRNLSKVVALKVDKAKSTGRYEPISLYPYIDPQVCIGSGACVKACPEVDVLGLMNGHGTLINTTSCVGHGACFLACPVDAISLRIGTEQRGVELPHVKPNYETNISGLYIAGELGGMGLIKNAIEQGIQAVQNLKPSQNNLLDLLIIGAGPAGIGAALKAKELGLNFKILEQDSLGGTVFTFPRAKIVMTHPVQLPLFGQVKLNNTSKTELLELWQQLINRYEIPLHENTKVESILKEDEVFNVKISTNLEFKSNNVLLAIGRRGTPRKLGIPGEANNERVAYRLLEPEHIESKKVLIVGGGDSAIESALLLMEKNTVYLSYRKNAFARIKPLNASRIQEAIDKQMLIMLFESELVEIQNNRVFIKIDAQIQAIEEVDHIYIFAGGELPTEFLKKAGIELEVAKNKILRKH